MRFKTTSLSDRNLRHGAQFLSISRAIMGLATAASLAIGASAQTASTFPGVTAVGQTSSPITVTVSVKAVGLASGIVGTSQGASSSDFTVVPGGTCTATAYLIVGATCTANVVFNPLYPGLRQGTVALQTASGAVLGQTLLSGVGQGGLAVLKPGIINTVAGSGDWIYRGDGNLAVGSPIFLPMGVVADARGDLFISDSSNNRIRRVDGVTGIISTVAGNGSPGFSGDGGLATLASISSPSSLLLDGAGDIYFVDNGNQCVRRVDAITGIITTVAGTGGVEGYTGDGAAATSATLSLPEGLAHDLSGDLFIADTGNNVIRRVDAVTGFITTYAGVQGYAGYSGDNVLATKSTLQTPWGLTVGPDNALYIADLSNNRIRRVDPSTNIMTTVAGSGNGGYNGDAGPAVQAGIEGPAAVAVDPAGNLYIGDSGNNCVREVNATTGIISTIVGAQGESLSGDGGPANVASLYGPYSLFIDQAGDLLIADMFHNRVRAVTATAVPFHEPTIRVGKISAPTPEGLENDGNAPLTLTSLPLNNAALDAATTTCVPGSLATSASCNLGVEFAPTVTGDTVYGSVTAQSNAGNSPNIITLYGEVLSVKPHHAHPHVEREPKPDRLARHLHRHRHLQAPPPSPVPSRSSMAPPSFATPSRSTPPPLPAPPPRSSPAPTPSPPPTPATRRMPQPPPSSSPRSSSSPPPWLSLSRPATSIVGASVSLTVTVTAPTGTPSGTATFYDDGTAIGSANLNAAGIATISTSALTAGYHTLLVGYSGDSMNAPGNSNNVYETVNLATSVTTLSSSATPVAVGTSVIYTATVSVTNSPFSPAAPTGTVPLLRRNHLARKRYAAEQRHRQLLDLNPRSRQPLHHGRLQRRREEQLQLLHRHR